MIGFCDMMTSSELSLSVLYLVPVAIVAWWRPGWRPYAAATAGVFVSVADDLARATHYSHPAYLFWQNAIRLVFLLVVAFLIVKLRRAYVALEEAARRDPLTGLLNRRGFAEESEREWLRMVRTGHPLTVVYLDLNDFKQVNDNLGHAAGDEVLCAVARELSNLRATDVAVRLGGDEFGVLMPATDLDAAHAAMERAQLRLGTAFLQQRWPVTLSIGMVCTSSAEVSLEALERAADEAMYAVKCRRKAA